MSVIQIELARDDAHERVAADRLLAVVSRYDLAKWVYCARVRVDATASHAFSHPVITWPARYAEHDDVTAVSLFLHEQMHWAAMTFPGCGDAIAEMRATHPDPPPPPRGAADAESSWLHFPVCALELHALTEVVGSESARALLRSRPFYSWIYEQILDNEPWYHDYLARHGIALPESPPLDEPGRRVLIPGGPVAVVGSGQPQEQRTLDALVRLHERYDLARFAHCHEIGIDATIRPTVDPVPVLGTRSVTDDGVLAHYLEMQHLWHVPSVNTDLAPALEALVPLDTRLATETVRSIVLACAQSALALRELIGADRARAVNAQHPLNADIYGRLHDMQPDDLARAVRATPAVRRTDSLGDGAWRVPIDLAGRGKLVVLDYVYGRVVWNRTAGWLARVSGVAIPEWPAVEPPGTYVPHADWFPSVLETAGTTNAVLVAWSLGSPGALRFAATGPAGLAGVIFVDPAGLVPPPAPFTVRPGPPPSLEEMARNRWRHWVRNDEVDRAPLEAAFVQGMSARPPATPAPPRPRTPTPPPALPRLAVPAAVFVGRHSNVLGVDGATVLAEQLGAELVVFEDSAHAIHLDEPRLFAARVHEFTGRAHASLGFS